MLGCGIMGINYIWSISLVRKLINDRKFQPLNLLSIFTKFITTLVVLYVAILYLGFSAGGLLVGLSNVVLAVIAFSFLRLVKINK